MDATPLCTLQSASANEYIRIDLGTSKTLQTIYLAQMNLNNVFQADVYVSDLSADDA